MHTKPKRNDFVRSKDGLVRGFVKGETLIPHKGGEQLAYRVFDGRTDQIIPADSIQIRNRDGFPWAEWLRIYRQKFLTKRESY